MVGSFPLAFQRSYSTEIITPNPPFAIPCPAGFEVGCAQFAFFIGYSFGGTRTLFGR